ncbi:MAG TPA: hypothetical protein VG734_16505 [Lacunisphaera sp.]|nr:hypothetical protein [Lacunisphaera sp.]
MENGKPPVNLSELIGADKYIKSALICPVGGHYEIPEGAKSGEEIFCTEHGTMQEIIERFQSTTHR